MYVYDQIYNECKSLVLSQLLLILDRTNLKGSSALYCKEIQKQQTDHKLILFKTLKQNKVFPVKRKRSNDLENKDC